MSLDLVTLDEAALDLIETYGSRVDPESDDSEREVGHHLDEEDAHVTQLVHVAYEDWQLHMPAAPSYRRDEQGLWKIDSNNEYQQAGEDQASLARAYSAMLALRQTIGIELYNE